MAPAMRLALFQPDIPQNTGAVLRFSACLGLAVDIIEPCGFLIDDRRLKRSLMDYAQGLLLIRHESWTAFLADRAARGDPGRIVLATTKAAARHVDFAFRATDTLLFGRESAGVPDAVAEAADARIRIPLMAGRRSLNIAMAAALLAGEALRQTAGFPSD
jgi:tRNA (cytidine/uridine-2'-O-)-methyltransferase